MEFDEVQSEDNAVIADVELATSHVDVCGAGFRMTQTEDTVFISCGQIFQVVELVTANPGASVDLSIHYFVFMDILLCMAFRMFWFVLNVAQKNSFIVRSISHVETMQQFRS